MGPLGGYFSSLRGLRWPVIPPFTCRWFLHSWPSTAENLRSTSATGGRASFSGRNPQAGGPGTGDRAAAQIPEARNGRKRRVVTGAARQRRWLSWPVKDADEAIYSSCGSTWVVAGTSVSWPTLPCLHLHLYSP